MQNELLARNFRNRVKRERKLKTNDDILSELLRTFDGTEVAEVAYDEEEEGEDPFEMAPPTILTKVEKLDDTFLIEEVKKARKRNDAINNEISDIIIKNLNTPKNLKCIAEKFYNSENIILKIEIEPHPNDELIFKDVILEENNVFTNKTDMIKIVLGYSQPEVLFTKVYRAADYITNKLKSIGFNVFSRHRDLSFVVSLKSTKSMYDSWEPK